MKKYLSLNNLIIINFIVCFVFFLSQTISQYIGLGQLISYKNFLISYSISFSTLFYVIIPNTKYRKLTQFLLILSTYVLLIGYESFYLLNTYLREGLLFVTVLYFIRYVDEKIHTLLFGIS